MQPNQKYVQIFSDEFGIKRPITQQMLLFGRILAICSIIYPCTLGRFSAIPIFQGGMVVDLILLCHKYKNVGFLCFIWSGMLKIDYIRLKNNKGGTNTPVFASITDFWWSLKDCLAQEGLPSYDNNWPGWQFPSSPLKSLPHRRTVGWSLTTRHCVVAQPTTTTTTTSGRVGKVWHTLKKYLMSSRKSCCPYAVSHFLHFCLMAKAQKY